MAALYKKKLKIMKYLNMRNCYSRSVTNVESFNLIVDYNERKKKM